MSDTKICKYCQTEIAKKAKICPNCRKKQGGPLGAIIAGIIVLFVLGKILGGGNSDTDSNKPKIDNSSAKTSSTDSSSATEKDPKTESPAQAEDSVVKIGGSYEGNGLKFTVNDAVINYTFEDEYGVYKLDDGLVYAMVDFTFENTGDSDKYVSIYDFKCYADNTACEQKYATSIVGDFINTNLSAGRNVSFKTLYAIPADASSVELEYEANAWTNEKVIVQIK